MPKLRKFSVQISGKKTELELWYETKRQLFTVKGLPTEFGQVVTFERHKKTEPELISALDEAIKKYHEAVKTEQDVILVWLSVFKGSTSKKVLRSNGWEVYMDTDGGKFPSNHKDMQEGDGFRLRFDRYTKVVGQETRYFLWGKNSDGDWEKHRYSEGNRFDGAVQLPFTEARFAFFEQAAGVLRDQALKISQFLQMDLTEMAALIDANTTQLLGERSEAGAHIAGQREEDFGYSNSVALLEERIYDQDNHNMNFDRFQP